MNSDRSDAVPISVDLHGATRLHIAPQENYRLINNNNNNRLFFLFPFLSLSLSLYLDLYLSISLSCLIPNIRFSSRHDRVFLFPPEQWPPA